MLTLLGWFNFLVAQWFFTRLAAVYDDQDKLIGFKWLIGVVPLTGWFGGNMQFVGEQQLVSEQQLAEAEPETVEEEPAEECPEYTEADRRRDELMSQPDVAAQSIYDAYGLTDQNQSNPVQIEPAQQVISLGHQGNDQNNTASFVVPQPELCQQISAGKVPEGETLRYTFLFRMSCGEVIEVTGEQVNAYSQRQMFQFGRYPLEKPNHIYVYRDKGETFYRINWSGGTAINVARRLLDLNARTELISNFADPVKKDPEVLWEQFFTSVQQHAERTAK